MKFQFMKQNKIKLFKVPILDGGVNYTKTTSDVKSNQIANSKNLIYSDYKLFSREGLYCDYDSLLDISAYSGAESVDYSITNTKTIIDGEKVIIAKANIIFDSSHRIVSFYGVSKNGFVKKLGYIHFSRTNSSTFFVPENVTVFCGKPCIGVGIFALVTTHNLNNPQEKAYKIYEAMETWGAWSICTYKYIPTSLINGRGTNYETAKAANIASLATPKILESPNLLNGNFYAYYTSDGYSSCFKLPFTSLANTSIKCNLFITPTKEVVWNITADNTTATATIDEKNVMMVVDRSKGIIYFKFDNEDFPIAKMNLFPENNIRFFASVATENKYNEIASCTIAVNHKNLNIFSGGINKSKIYYSRNDNPMYFREFGDNTIGNNLSQVTALISENDKIFAFKNESVYSITPTATKAINTTPLLSDNNSVFYEPISFKINCINNHIGADSFNKIAYVNKNLLWYSSGRLYCLNTSNKNLSEITTKIDEYIEKYFDKTLPISLAYFSDKVILTNQNKAIVIRLENDKNTLNTDDFSFFIWEFPVSINICGIGTLENGFVLICKSKDNNYGFAGIFKGNKDFYTTGTKVSVKIVEQAVDFSLETKYYNFGEFNEKFILKDGLLLFSSTGDTQINIKTDKNDFKYQLKNGYDLKKFNEPLELKVDSLPTKGFSIIINSINDFNYLDARFRLETLED